ncbi:Methyltransferase type 12 (fragment) [Rhodospirillaceae bacterium LM-1]
MPDNLKFVEGDATHQLPDGRWDVVVLSNILEHIELRVDFLKAIVVKTRPKRILIRVPMFERDWQIALRKELGIDFRSDPTHMIEHTLPEFEMEIAKAGLRTCERLTLWGEIWATVEPIS